MLPRLRKSVKCFMWQEKRQHRRVSRICDTGDIPLPRSLTRYARSFGCGERYRLTDGDGNFLEDTRKTLSKEEIRPRRSRFSIGSAPLTSIAKSDAQISGGETRQDYKDPRRFPGSSSCALLFLPSVYRCHSAVMAAVSHSTPDTQFREGSSLQADCMHEPPFSPTAAPCPVTINLSPTRKDTTKRHWQQPLVTGVHEKID